MAKTQSSEALLKQLKNPFEPGMVKWTNKGGKSPKPLAYIDARDVMKRLDDVLGADNYQTKYVQVGDGFICELSVLLDGVWITRSDGANNTKIEPIKGGISDALKRAANAWGVGRYLYYLPKWANGDNIDKWPKWALPNSGLENWENVAELEAEAGTGMDDEEITVSAVKLYSQILATNSSDELTKLLDTVSLDDQRIYADIIKNKSEEFINGTSDKKS